MKKIITIVSMLAMVAVVACNDELAIEKVPGDASVKPATISLSIPKGGLTKVSLTQDANPDGSVKLAWESTDAITVKNAADESKSVAFTYVSGAGTSNAVFSTADVSALDGATSYNIYLTSNLPGGYNSQTQASNGSTAHLGYAASLKGVNKYDSASFSSAWAGAVENGSGTFESSSVLRIRAQMPTAAIADAVQKVNVKASEEIFGGEKELTVSITTPGVEGDGKVITVYATLPAGDVVIPANTELLFQFQVSANNYDKYTHYRKVTSSATLSSGQVNSFKIDCPNIASYANSSTESIGTSTNPYLIGDKNQLNWLASSVASSKIYKLVDDIDATGFATSINPDGAITFDGNNKKISNLTAPLFNDLKGIVKDLTIYNAVVSSANTVGILANTCNNVASDVDGVTISNCSLTGTASSGTYFLGGLVGEVSSASTFDDCHLDESTLTSTKYVKSGGLFGYIHNSGAKVGYTTGCTVNDTNTLTLKDNAGGLVAELDGGSVDKSSVACSFSASNTVGGLVAKLTSGSLTGDFVTGNVTSTYQTVGGLIGKMSNGTVSGCYATGNVTHNYSATYAQAGGLIGDMSGGSLVLCYATGTVEAKNTGANVGGLIGTNSGGTIDQCYATGEVTGPGNSVGGFIGNMGDGAVTITKSYATGLATNGAKACGGFIGNMTGSSNKEISECYAIGNYKPKSDGAGGFIGRIEGSNSSNFSIHDCYATGNATSNVSQCGGFVGLISKSAGTVSIANCFASGTNWAGYGYGHGGFAGRVETTIVTIQKCAAWNSQVKGQTELNKWSAGAIVGVAHPLCTLTDNYRKPGMTLHAYWGTSGQNKLLSDEDQHDNVSSSTPLVTVQSDGTTLAQTTKTSLSNSDGVAIFAYQGKCVAGQTLSQLASSTSYLNWGTEKWDYTQDMPRLKWTLGE